MGFLDSILAPFGYGDPIGKAAAAKTAGINAGLGMLDQSYGAGRDVLGTNYSGALDFLKGQYGQGQDFLTGQYGQGQDILGDYYTKALAPYNTLAPTATGGYQAYADASGASGPAGFARANEIFQKYPGYQSALDAARNATERSGVAAGRATGNILDETARSAADISNKYYGQYVSQLAPWLQQGQQIAGAQSDVASRFGPLAAAGAQDLGRLGAQGMFNLGGLGSQGQMNLGNLLGKSYFDQGGQQFGAQTGIGDANATSALAPYLYGQNMLEGVGQFGKFLGGGGLNKLGSGLFSGLTGKQSLFGIPGR